MAVNEFEPDEIFGELNRKFANVSLEPPTFDDIYKEIMYGDVSYCTIEYLLHIY
jgi:hypothetical protein